MRWMILLIIMTLGGKVAAQGRDVYADVPREAFLFVGPTSRGQLMASPHQAWLQAAYEAYQPVPATISALANQTDGLDLWLFIGTWCSDTRLKLPALLKVLDQAGVTEDRVHWVAVDENKHDPEGLYTQWRITRAPTLVVMQGERELGRIVETPTGTWEENLLQIFMAPGR